MLRDLLADMLFLSRFSLKSVEVYVKGLNDGMQYSLVRDSSWRDYRENCSTLGSP